MYKGVKRKCNSFHSIWLLNTWWEVKCPPEGDFVLLILSVGFGRAILVWCVDGDILEIAKNISSLVLTLYDSGEVELRFSSILSQVCIENLPCRFGFLTK